MSEKACAVISMLGGAVEAAKFYDVTVGAISQWKANGIPPARELDLLRRRPDIFFAAEKIGAGETEKKVA